MNFHSTNPYHGEGIIFTAKAISPKDNRCKLFKILIKGISEPCTSYKNLWQVPLLGRNFVHLDREKTLWLDSSFEIEFEWKFIEPISVKWQFLVHQTKFKSTRGSWGIACDAKRKSFNNCCSLRRVGKR